MNPLRILLVDDDASTRAALGRWLERAGFVTTTADGPSMADRAFALGSFDVVLSDCLMPGNTQLEWVERRLQVECLPPILLMTGNPELPIALRAANLPVAGYVLKPLDYAAVRNRIEVLGRDYRRRTEMLSLAHGILRLLATALADPMAAVDPYLAELHRLACELSLAARHRPRDVAVIADPGDWRQAVSDTIHLLGQTRERFAAREVTALRDRFTRLAGPRPSHQPRQLVDLSAN